MKKIFAIVALAAAAASAGAQNVTISGQFDAAYSSLNSQTNTADKSDIIGNGASTSNIAFQATEDLGGGVKAGFRGVHLFNATSGQTGNGTTAFSTNNFFNDELWVGIESNKLGQIKIGAPNAGMADTNSRSNPFGTALGSGYSSTGINRLLGATTTLGVNQFVGGAAANGRVIRSEKSVRYDTPTFAGFSANLVKSFQNDNSTTLTSNNNGFTNLTANYRRGALNVAYSVAEADAGAVAAQGNNAAGALVANSSVKYQYLAANYTKGATTVFGGVTTGETKGLASNRDVQSHNIGVRHALTPKIDIMGNVVKVNDKSAANAVDQDLKAIGAVYKFSRRTSTYATYMEYDTDKSTAAAGAATQFLVGLRHQF